MEISTSTGAYHPSPPVNVTTVIASITNMIMQVGFQVP